MVKIDQTLIGEVNPPSKQDYRFQFMNARSPTEVYLCVNKPGSGPPLYNNYQRGLIKFTNLAVNTNIQWFIKIGDHIVS